MLLALASLILQGCQLGEDDGLTDEVETVIYSTDEGEPVITSSGTYKMVLKADDTYTTLKDDISEITVQGNINTIVISEDTSIETITIVGDDNIIEVEAGVELTVTDLTIIGNGNYVTVFDITNDVSNSFDGEGTPNVVCENTTCT